MVRMGCGIWAVFLEFRCYRGSFRSWKHGRVLARGICICSHGLLREKILFWRNVAYAYSASSCASRAAIYLVCQARLDYLLLALDSAEVSCGGCVLCVPNGAVSPRHTTRDGPSCSH